MNNIKGSIYIEDNVPSLNLGLIIIVRRDVTPIIMQNRKRQRKTIIALSRADLLFFPINYTEQQLTTSTIKTPFLHLQKIDNWIRPGKTGDPTFQKLTFNLIKNKQIRNSKIIVHHLLQVLVTLQ